VENSWRNIEPISANTVTPLIHSLIKSCVKLQSHYSGVRWDLGLDWVDFRSESNHIARNLTRNYPSVARSLSVRQSSVTAALHPLVSVH